MVYRAIGLVLDFIHRLVCGRLVYGLDSRGFGIRYAARVRDFPHSITSEPALRFTQPATQWITGLFPREHDGRGVNLTTDFHLVPRLGMVELFLHLLDVFMARCLINYCTDITLHLT
jgi:hypothetical protein